MYMQHVMKKIVIIPFLKQSSRFRSYVEKHVDSFLLLFQAF